MTRDDDTSWLLRFASAAAADKKAFDIVGLDVAPLTSFADFFLLCSGASARQVGAIADAIEERLRGGGRRPLHVERTSSSEWVLMDYGDLIVHIFTEERRSYYALDSLWGDARSLLEGDLGIEQGRSNGK
jgi:ribosome-associated protein